MASSMIKSPSSNPMRPRHHKMQNFLLIWVDETIDEDDEDYQNTLSQLRSVVKQVNLCTTTTQCVEALNDVDDGKAFIVASGALGQHIVPCIHDMACVDAIYIFCGNKARHEGWAKEWSKIRGVFTSINPICDSLKQVARECDHNAIPMSFVAKQEGLKELPPTYMYSILFKEIIFEIDDDETHSMNNLVKYCLQQNITEQELKDFQREYQCKTPIYMYTCDMFLYSMLNRALWSLDTRTMSKMGFFIRKLHQQLEQLHQEQKDKFKVKFTVYRGQGLTSEQFQRLVNTKSGLVSFNNFLSTSKEKEVAMNFVQNALANKDNVAVLFIMAIDPHKISNATTPYAIIDEYSEFHQEQEILFSMHTVFLVDDIKQAANNSRLWEVQLTLTDDNDPQLANLTQSMRKSLCGSTGWHRMADLMFNLGHFDQAQEVFNRLLEECSNDSDRAHIYHQLGRVKWQQGQYDQEITLYEKSLEIYRKTLPEYHISLAPTYTNMGLAYKNMGDYTKALEYYEKSLKIKEKAFPLNHPSLATSYSNIGSVYDNMGDYLKALEYYEKSLKMREQVLPANHPLLATSYNNIGLVYSNMNDYSKALQYYEKSLKMREKALPPNHPALAQSFNNIGFVYKKKSDYSKALEYYEKSLEIEEKAHSPDHPDLAISYGNIGQVYNNMSNYSKALGYFEKALAILQKNLPPTHPNINTMKDNIDCVKKKM